MTTLRVTLAQIRSGADPQANLALLAAEAEAAVAEGAELVVFPEASMRCFGGPLGPVAEPVDGAWAASVRALASRLGVVIVVGMFTPAEDGRVRNTLLATGPGVDASYDKIHLYDAYGFTESATVAPGDEPVVIKVGDAQVGLSTCYDVRFPSLYTRLAEQGAELIVVAASWGAGPGKLEQWRLLTRARALDATSFVLAAGQAAAPGADLEAPEKVPTGIGHSVAVSPRGQVLAELGSGSGRLTLDCDLDEVDATRGVLPVLVNRRI